MKAAAATLTAALLVALLLAVVHPAVVSVDAFQTAPVQIFPLLWLSKRLTSDKNDPPSSSSSSSAFSSRRRRTRSRLPPPPLRINAIRTPRLQQQRRRRQRYGGGRQKRRRGASSLTSISTTTATRRIPFLLSPLVTLANIITTKLDSTTKSSLSDKKLLHWITEESSYYDNIDTANNNMISSSIGIETHPTTNIRGLYAKRNYAPNEIIIEIPYDMALLVGDSLRPTYYNVDFSSYPNSDSWDTNDVDDVLQGLYFLENYVLGRSFMNNDDHRNNNNGGGYDTMMDDGGEYYSPYVKSLPSKPTTINNYDNEEGLTPDFWSDSIITELGLPSYTQQVLNRKQIIKAIASNNNVNESDLQWATYLIRSRRFTTWNMVPDPSSSEEGAEYGSGPFGTFPTINNKKVEQIQGFLVPLIDMANHHPTPNAVMKISVNKWTRKFDTSSSFALRATKPILQGDEITISYGDGSSTCLELLDKYGFFVDNNQDENGVDDNGIDLDELQPTWDSSVEEDQMELDALLAAASMKDEDGGIASSSKLKSIVSHFQNEYTTVNFPTTLDDEGRMKLIGSGIREKMGVNIYGVGLYGSSQSLLSNAVSPSDLRYKASQFDNGDGMMTSFVLEMILQADGKIIAEAIADSVGIRYDGSLSDIDQLESLISDGIVGQANKGMMLRFDCTKEGVALLVNGVERGAVRAGSSLAKAFVDVYLDNNAVSPSLIDSCIDTSSSSVATSGVKNGIDGTASASRRSMLSLRIWLKRLKKWKKPDSSVVEGVPKNEVAVSDQDDAVSIETETTGFVSGALGAVERSSTSADDSSSEVERTDQEQQIIEEKNNIAIVDESTEGAANGVTSEEVAESNVIESTAPVEEATQEEIVQTPETTTFAVSSKTVADIESKLGSGLTDKATSVSFQPKLDDGLYLAGVGVRKKAIINVYAAAMYTSPMALASVATLSKGKDAQSALRESARSFGPATPTTSFVLEMTFKADGKAIGEAIGEGVKPRYSGPEADVKQLESLIIDGVKSKGGQATKGTIFRFDCTAEGISVSVDGALQGQVACEGIGSALVDVFMDDNAVSQQLVDSCLGTWCGSGLVIEQAEAQSITSPIAVNQDLPPTSTEPAMTGLPEVTATPPFASTPVANVALDQSKFDSNQIAARIRELEAEIAAEIVRVKGGQSAPTPVAGGYQSVPETTASTVPVVDEKAAAVASKVKSIKEKATGVSFAPTLEDGLFLVGAGVRKKAIINVYAVSMYSSATAIASLGSLKKGKDAQATLRDSSRTFNALTPKTSFVLEMTFKADGKTIAEAIADGVKPRHGGPVDDVAQLENLIIEGVKSKGGQATKGTIFRFDCSEEGISVSVDGNMQGKVMSQGIGSALVDVFMDNNAVSPQLVDSCMDTWCGSGL